MKQVQVSATVPENKEKGIKEASATITVNFAESVKEAVEMYGEEALLSNAFANWRVTLQSTIRGGLKRGEDQAAIQSRLGTAKMGVAVTGAKVDPVQAYLAKFAASTPEQQKDMLAELQKRAMQK